MNLTEILLNLSINELEKKQTSFLNDSNHNLGSKLFRSNVSSVSKNKIIAVDCSNRKRKPAPPKYGISIPKLMEFRGNKCYYCSITVVYLAKPKLNHYNATIDHKIPRSKGGLKKNISNLEIACFYCNGKKGNMTEEEYKQSSMLQERIAYVKNVSIAQLE